MRTMASRSSERAGCVAQCRAGKFERAIARNEPGPSGLFKKQAQAREIFLVEVEIDVIGQIALERARRQLELHRSGFGNFAESLEAILLRRLKIRDDFRRDCVAPARPDREDTLLDSHFLPFISARLF